MRAVRVHELTGPAALRVDDDVPEPTVSAGQVLIDVKAAGVNFPDILQTRGIYQFKPTPPFSPGGEAAGIVRAVGAGVTSVAPGDRVACSMIHGAYAEVVSVPELAVIGLPDAVSFEIGAATLLTYATTYHALVDRAAIKPGETLLVLGASGGVGIAAVELGVLLGARVIAAASADDKLAFCRAHGAAEGINYAREDLKARIKALTSGGCDVIYDPVGGALAEPALRGIAWQGRYLVVGFASGDIPKIPLNLVLLKGCQIVGVFWGSFAMREPARNREHAAQIFTWIAEGKLAPHIDAVVPFTEAASALQRLERREVKGKLVLVP
ncbi:MAG: NADPH:quinone oxidoreductase family protein [Deltaproteobacteria bacterium]|nr:NADPH:quinone oxidoreductase family protein [Deltaproteobacteria bacterium]MDQ3297834.1 NADPH:quinone oxidoreductase family protein [Myxococcota bacterium]